ncbi:hypothetical protein [Afifella pfennigii]|uniref:hypothetical protein n=1 Tax=Afifella pfennigii TaxID=209897 RepID=UPI00047B2CB3|nr:hypothetical protein [Afifella pfennigii]
MRILLAAGAALALGLSSAAYAQTDASPQDEIVIDETASEAGTGNTQQARPGWGPGNCPNWGDWGPGGRGQGNWQRGGWSGDCGPGMRGRGPHGQWGKAARQGQRGTMAGRGMSTSFAMRRGDSVIRVNCSPRETAEACVDAAIRLIEATREAAAPAPGN